MRKNPPDQLISKQFAGSMYDHLNGFLFRYHVDLLHPVTDLVGLNNKVHLIEAFRLTEWGSSLNQVRAFLKDSLGSTYV